MGEKVIRRIQPFASSGLDGMAEVHSVPVDEDGGEQIKSVPRSLRSDVLRFRYIRKDLPQLSDQRAFVPATPDIHRSCR